ncbi:MAG: hemerythrin [Armatimonadetes bacterium]|nr:hemerythrin [Armatimonadota bacterium]NIM23483.1 hemerythrin [Armatimonadota bacterium]NIM67349.1 hemerythrin [Armatimonadota bacterium]NIM75850.1 hemerythrin [Armatimonadota bacterium]NIN05535.1 hemerythrin [Armatimonadota bacterium]
MESTAILRHEHRVIEVVLEGLERMVEAVESGESLDSEKAEKALEILQNFADKCHHGKEEQRLFELLEARGISREAGPIGVMLAEHEQGRSHIRGMLEALPNATAGEEAAKNAFVENARAYVDLLRRHIQKEDNILFPMGEQVLTEKDDRQLTEAFETFEREEMGEGVHEKYHQWAHELVEE